MRGLRPERRGAGRSGIGNLEEIEEQRQGGRRSPGRGGAAGPAILLAGRAGSVGVGDPEDSPAAGSRTGSSGTARAWDRPRGRRTVTPRSGADPANSSHRRLLPTPALTDDADHLGVPASAPARGRLRAPPSRGPVRPGATRPGERDSPRRRRAVPSRTEHPDRVTGSLDRARAEIPEAEGPRDQPGGVLAEVGRARLGQGLHALGEADGVTQGGVLHAGRRHRCARRRPRRS